MIERIDSQTRVFANNRRQPNSLYNVQPQAATTKRKLSILSETRI